MPLADIGTVKLHAAVRRVVFGRPRWNRPGCFHSELVEQSVKFSLTVTITKIEN